MATDMTVPCGDGFVNLRVGAIIQKDGKFLMVGNDTQDYFLLPYRNSPIKSTDFRLSLQVWVSCLLLSV